MKKKKKILIGTMTFVLILLGILLWIILGNRAENQTKMITKNLKIEEMEQTEKEEKEIQNKEEIKVNLPEYQNMKQEIGGYKVIGKLTIPKIQLEKYILEKTDEKSLKLGITKIYGPAINQEGNFCIVGHNYQSPFGKLKKLEVGDSFTLTDTYQRSVNYIIYEIQKVSPDNTACLNQDTRGEREVTLITCTLGAIQRLIIKGIEVYD